MYQPNWGSERGWWLPVRSRVMPESVELLLGISGDFVHATPVLFAALALHRLRLSHVLHARRQLRVHNHTRIHLFLQHQRNLQDLPINRCCHMLALTMLAIGGWQVAQRIPYAMQRLFSGYYMYITKRSKNYITNKKENQTQNAKYKLFEATCNCN